MYKVDKMIEQYQVDNFRNELNIQKEDMLDELQYYAQDKNRHIEEVQDLVTKMINQHKESLEKPAGEMITNCFEEYGNTIDQMEQKDIK